MNNIDLYNERMKKSFLDKLFFLDKVESNVFIDFGCADGNLIKIMSSLFPEKFYIGIDSNPKMEKLFKESLKDVPNVLFYKNIKEMVEGHFLRYVDPEFNKPCIILSSVLHEIADKKELFKEISSCEYIKTIVVRDMCFDIPDSHTSNMSKEFQGALEVLHPKIRAIYSETTGHNALKALEMIFKQEYVGNADEKELAEKYFSLSPLDFSDILDKDFHTVYSEFYLLHYWRELIKKKYNFDLQGNYTTHVKLILERNGKKSKDN